jgi:archaellum component FlaC
MAIDPITKEVSGNITDLPAVYPIASVIPLNKDTIKAYNAAEEAIRATLADNIIPELRTIIADVNELTDKFNTFGTQVDAEGDAINQLKTDVTQLKSDTEQIKTATQGIYDNTVQIKTDTQGIYNNTNQLKSDVTQLKSDTEQIKTDTQGIHDNTVQLKADTEQFKDDTETAKDDAVEAKDIAVQAAEDAQAAAAGDVIDDEDVSLLKTWSSAKLEPLLNTTIGTLTKSFAENEEYRIPLSKTALPPVVSVTKEVPQLDLTNNTWDVNVGEFEQEGTDLEIAEGSISIPATVLSTEGETVYRTHSVVSSTVWASSARSFSTTQTKNGNIVCAYYNKTDSSAYYAIYSSTGSVVLSGTIIATDTTNKTVNTCAMGDGGFIVTFGRNIYKYDSTGTLQSTTSSTGLFEAWLMYRYNTIKLLSNGKIACLFGNNTGTYYGILNADLTVYKAQTTFHSSYTMSSGDIAEYDNGNIAFVVGEDTTDDIDYIVTNANGATVRALTQIVAGTFVSHYELSACTLSNGDLIVSVYWDATDTLNLYKITSSWAQTSTSLDQSLWCVIERSQNDGNTFVGVRLSKTNGNLIYEKRNSSFTLTGSKAIYTPTHTDGKQAKISYLNNNRIVVLFPEIASESVPIYLTILSGYELSRTKNEYISAVTTTAGQIDTTFWTNLDTLTASETLNGQTIYYALSADSKETWCVSKVSDGVRNITRNNVGTWEYNSAETYGDETWTVATTNNEFQARSEAMSVAANRMDSTQMLALTEAEYVELNTTLDLAVMLHTDSDTSTPEFTGLTIQYDGNIKNQACVLGTDYEWSTYDGTTVEFKALQANNLKIRVV